MSRLLLIFALLLTPSLTFAISTDANLRDTSTITVDATINSDLKTFGENGWIAQFFIDPVLGGDTVENSFVSVAGALKNFFILIAVLFLIIGIIKLLFRSGEEEDMKKWRHNIIYVSVGIFVMQIGYSVWRTLYLNTSYN